MLVKKLLRAGYTILGLVWKFSFACKLRQQYGVLPISKLAQFVPCQLLSVERLMLVSTTWLRFMRSLLGPFQKARLSILRYALRAKCFRLNLLLSDYPSLACSLR